MKYSYKTKNTCSSLIDIELNDEQIIEEVRIKGGCQGSMQGLAKLVMGMAAVEAVKRLKGINCGNKGTSCPDQLALALEQGIIKNGGRN